MRLAACWLGLAMLIASAPVRAGPAEDAEAVVTRWSATYNTNDPDALTQTYWPDAVLLGTTSPTMSVGAEAITKYFSGLPRTGHKNEIEEKRTIALDNDTALVFGFYLFTLMLEGKPTPIPARFTMLVTQRDGAWKIAHHHSSPRGLLK